MANTVYNRKAVKEAFQQEAKKSIKILAEDIPLNVRNKNDFLISKLLGHNLASHEKKETLLEEFLADYKSISEEYRIDKVLAFDTETTDRDGYIVSIACILYSLKEDKVLEEYYSLVNPEEEISQGAYEVHQITQEDLVNAKKFPQIWEEVKHMFEEADTATGHNLIFDLNVLEREFDRAEMINPIQDLTWFDTMKLNKERLKLKDKNGKKVKEPALEECVEAYGIVLEDTTYHNALVDTKATLEVFKKTINEEPTVAELKEKE